MRSSSPQSSQRAQDFAGALPVIASAKSETTFHEEEIEVSMVEIKRSSLKKKGSSTVSQQVGLIALGIRDRSLRHGIVY